MGAIEVLEGQEPQHDEIGDGVSHRQERKTGDNGGHESEKVKLAQFSGLNEDKPHAVAVKDLAAASFVKHARLLHFKFGIVECPWLVCITQVARANHLIAVRGEGERREMRVTGAGNNKPKPTRGSYSTSSSGNCSSAFPVYSCPPAFASATPPLT